MAFSRRSLRRVIGGMVHRHNGKPESIDSGISDQKSNIHRSRKKSDRNSLISNGSLPLPQTSSDRLRQSEKELCKSLNYLDQVLTHHKLEILSNIITSLIENVFDIESIFKGIFEHESEAFRTRLLHDVYSLLADLIDWSDQWLLAEDKSVKPDERYKTIAEDLIQAIQTCISIACDASSVQGIDTRSDSYRSFRSNTGSMDEFPPVLPPKRDKRPVSSSATIISNRSRSNDESKHSLILSSSASSTRIKPEKDNDACIQLIVDDINQIVEKYTRELDEALRTKKNVRSPSMDQLPSKPSLVPQNSIDTLFESQISKITKSTTTKTTVNDGQGNIDRKESSQVYNEMDCSIHSPKGDIQTQKFTLTHRQKSKDDNEQEKIIITSRITPSNPPDSDPPPLPPKGKTGQSSLAEWHEKGSSVHTLLIRSRTEVAVEVHFHRTVLD